MKKLQKSEASSGRPLVKDRVLRCFDKIYSDETSPYYQLSQEKLLYEFEERYGAGRLSRGTLRNAKNGNNVQYKTAQALAALFGCSAAYLYGDADDPGPQLVPAEQVAQSIASLDDETFKSYVQKICDALMDFKEGESLNDEEESAGFSTQARQAKLQSSIESNVLSCDPKDPNSIWKKLPRFYWEEEARSRQIVLRASHFISPEAKVESPTQDWLNLFRQYAPKAADPKLMALWARVLGQEIKYPGSISHKTLMTIPALTSRIAANLVRFSGGLFAIEGGEESGNVSRERHLAYIRPQDNKGPIHYLQYFGLNYGQVVELEEYGLVALSHRAFDIEPGVKFSYGPFVFFSKEKFRISVNTLTTVGEELFPLFEATPSVEYLKGVHRSLKEYVSPYRERSSN